MLKILASVGALQLLVMALLLVRTKLLAVWLGPEAIGLLAVVDRLLALFAQTASLSLPFAALRFLAPLWGTDLPGHDALYRRMRANLGLFCGAAAVVGAATAWFAPQAFGDELVAHRALLVAAFATVPVLGFVPFLQNALASRAAPRAAMLFLLAHAAVFSAASLAGARAGGLVGLYLTYAVAGSLLVTLAATRGLAPVGGRREPRASPGGLPATVWRFGLTLVALAFAAPFAGLYAAYRLLDLRGAAVAGWMQAAFGVAVAVRAVLGAANQVYLTPRINRDAPVEERGRWMGEYLRQLTIGIGLVVPPVVLLPDLVVRILYSPEFAPAASFVALFVLAEVVVVLGGVPQSLVIALDRLRVHVVLNLVAQLLLVALAWALVPRWGIAGVGGAMLAAAVWLLVAPAVYLRRLAIPAPPRSTIALLGVVVAGISGCGAIGALVPAGIPRFAAASLAYAAILAAMAALLTGAERRDLGGVLAALRSRFGGGSTG